MIVTYALLITMCTSAPCDSHMITYVATTLPDRAQCITWRDAYQKMFDRRGARASVACARRVVWEEVR